MDDLWGNAWSQSNDDNNSKSLPSSSSKVFTVDDAPWQLPSSTEVENETTDVTSPSWNTKIPSWSEPSGQPTLWGSNDVSEKPPELRGWDASADFGQRSDVFLAHGDSTNLGLEIQADAAESSETDVTVTKLPQPDLTDTDNNPFQAGEHVISSNGDLSVSSYITHEEGVSEPKESPEVKFDEYTMGATVAPQVGDDSFDGDETWSSPVATFNDVSGLDDAWGSAWGSTPPTSSAPEPETSQAKDEWDLAKERKIARDRAVVRIEPDSTRICIDIFEAS